MATKLSGEWASQPVFPGVAIPCRIYDMEEGEEYPALIVMNPEPTTYFYGDDGLWHAITQKNGNRKLTWDLRHSSQIKPQLQNA